MGLFKRKDERAIPKPGTPEFDEAVKGTALPDDQSVSMGEPGWTEPDEAEQPNQAAEGPQKPDESEASDGAQPGDESDERGRGERMLGALGRSVLRPPNADGFGGGLSAPKKKSGKDGPEK